MSSVKDRLKLYAVTDRSCLKKPFFEAIELTLQGGATMLQLREKNVSDAEYIATAKKVKEITDKYKVPLIINDNVNVALSSGAAGVHLGQCDGDVKNARKVLGPSAIIGVSAHNLDEALKAQSEGASYLGLGAAFATGTKKDADVIGVSVITQIVSKVKIPCCAIGGINMKTMGLLAGSGVAGFAIVSAIFGVENIKKATEDLLYLSDLSCVL